MAMFSPLRQAKNRHGRFQESRLFEQLFEQIVRQCMHKTSHRVTGALLSRNNWHITQTPVRRRTEGGLKR